MRSGECEGVRLVLCGVVSVRVWGWCCVECEGVGLVLCGV